MEQVSRLMTNIMGITAIVMMISHFITGDIEPLIHSYGLAIIFYVDSRKK